MIHMNFTDFIKSFNLEQAAVEYLRDMSKQGLIEITCNTLPQVKIESDSVTLSEFKNVHGYTIHIQNWDEDAAACVVFEYEDLKWFKQYIEPYNDIGLKELYVDNSESELTFALLLQLKITRTKLCNARQYLRQNVQSLTPHQIDQYCINIAEMVGIEKALLGKVAS